MFSTLNISELPELNAHDVATRNADLQFFARRIYQFAGLQWRLERQDDAGSSGSVNAGGVWLGLVFGGQDVVLHCSHASVQTLLQSQGWSVDDLSEEALSLMGQTRLAPVLPAGVALQRLSFSASGLLSSALKPQGSWVARHATTQEPSEIAVGVWAPPGFAIHAFVKTWDAWLLKQEKPRFAGMPWTMPLIAARWKTEVADIHGLAVGDVLLIDA